MPSHPDRSTALATPLAELRDHWVGLDCACGRLVKYPCKLLAQRVGGATRLADALDRFRCEHCHAAPARAFLTDDPTGGTQGKVAWKVDLAP